MYVAFTPAVLDRVTIEAILNRPFRSVTPCRRSIKIQSVWAAQTAPSASWNKSRRTGQPRPESGLEGMNWAPSGGLPKISKVEGLSEMPAVASFALSISAKNMIFLSAMSFFRPRIVSATQ